METGIRVGDIWSILEQVSDPEIPVLSVVDLGIVRDVKMSGDTAEIYITPTYNGCPAMNTIEMEIRAILEQNGIEAKVFTILSPPWTTDWLSEQGRHKLQAYGIAPPQDEQVSLSTLFGKPTDIRCPLCGSRHTELVSLFGSTACKSLYKCKDCLEPFDYFKCLK